jgi:uncharacterized protein YbcI
MRTLGVCEGVSRFEQDYMGQRSEEIHTHLIETVQPVMETMIR